MFCLSVLSDPFSYILLLSCLACLTMSKRLWVYRKALYKIEVLLLLLLLLSPDYHVSCRILVGLLFLDYCCLQPKPVLHPKLCLDFESCLAFWKPLLCLAYSCPTLFCSVT